MKPMTFRTFKYIFAAFACICCSQADLITEIFTLPESLKEASALETTSKSQYVWTLEDHGNAPKLYALDNKGKIVHTLGISNAQNNDWEALAADPEGNLYIGDFGNNDNDRRDLCIYKIDYRDLEKETAEYAAKISFHYPEQTEFPPKKSGKFFDAEAFFFYKNQLYLFTKNRSGKGGTFIYSIPAAQGVHAAKMQGEIPTCDEFRKCAITDADISDDGKKIVLLSNQKVWLIENFKGDDFVNGKLTEIDLNHHTQLEGICFKGKSNVYLVDEKDKGTGGKVYEMKL